MRRLRIPVTGDFGLGAGSALERMLEKDIGSARLGVCKRYRVRQNINERDESREERHVELTLAGAAAGLGDDWGGRSDFAPCPKLDPFDSGPMFDVAACLEFGEVI